MSQWIARYRLFSSATKVCLAAGIALLLAFLAVSAADRIREHYAKAIVDSDHDGLSDADELSIHNTNPTLPDTDGDGTNDGDEVRAGTNPNNPASVFRILGPPERVAEGWRVRWASVPGKTYQVLRADGLAPRSNF